ncbi:unnamed protein product [Somion occarium]|uniref:Protein kinase domain-containing protein n=1 Tax=Somion occarium TaxID=3059160 RepID=A0ABP1CEM7_9APHY
MILLIAWSVGTILFASPVFLQYLIVLASLLTCVRRLWRRYGCRVLSRLRSVWDELLLEIASFDLATFAQIACNYFHTQPSCILIINTIIRTPVIQVTEDFAETHCILIATDDGMTARAAFGLMFKLSRGNSSYIEDGKIVNLVFSALRDPSRRVAVRTLRGGDAQRALQLIEKLLLNEDNWSGKPSKRGALRSLFIELAQTSKQFPNPLICTLSNVARLPATCGRYTDIYHGTLNNTRVAVYKSRRPHAHHTRPQLMKSDIREYLLGSYLRHSNIIHFSNIDLTSFPGSLCGISPLVDKSDNAILRRISNSRQSPSVSQLNRWLLDIAEAVIYLHSEGVVHGSLRCENVTLTTDGRAQLSGFSLSDFTDYCTEEDSYYTEDRAYEHERWQPPEVLCPDRFKSYRPTRASDIYSFGCFSMELYNRAPPFHYMSKMARRSLVISGNIVPIRPRTPENVEMPDALWDLAVQCLSSTPDSRPQMIAWRRICGG